MLSTMLSVNPARANERLFSFYRLIDKGFGILIFILLIACAAAFLLDRYFNKSATPEEILRRAINNGEIVPFYQPVVNGREGTLRELRC